MTIIILGYLYSVLSHQPTFSEAMSVSRGHHADNRVLGILAGMCHVESRGY
jgi:hypothetical protein